MARARMLKPGFFTNDDLAELPMAARLLFAGLWTIADRAGRLEDRPRRIKAEILPYDDEDVDDLLTRLAARGFITRYQAGGSAYIAIVNFGKHQSPHVREPDSAIPAPDEHDASTVQAPDEHDASTSSRAPIPFPIPEADTDTHSGKPIPERDAAMRAADKPPNGKQPPEHRLLLLALAETEGYAADAHLTKNEFGRIGKAASQLLTSGATPEEIRVRADRYRTAHPDWEYTANALANHWGKLTTEPVPNARAPNGTKQNGSAAANVEGWAARNGHGAVRDDDAGVARVLPATVRR